MAGVDPNNACMRNLAFGIVMLGLGLAKSVTEPPLDLQFKSPQASFLGCNGCLHAESNKPFYIECYLTGTTGEVVGQISVGSKNISTGPVLSGRFSAEVIVGEKDHLADVKCQVIETLTSVVTKITKKLYVTVRPETPELTGTTVKEGRPSNIACSAMGGRPPAKLSISIGGNKMDVKQTDLGYQSFTGSIVYKSSVEVHDYQKSWHQQEIKCCIIHETLENLECSTAKNVTCLFPPSEVKVNNWRDVINGQTVFMVDCAVVNANPACDAVIDIPEDRILNTSIRQEISKNSGTTTILHVLFDRIDEKKYHLVKCSANCSEFDVTMYRYANITQQDEDSDKSDDIGVAFASAFLVMMVVVIMVAAMASEADEQVVTETHGARRQIVSYSAPPINTQTPISNDVSLTFNNTATTVDINTMSDEV